MAAPSSNRASANATAEVDQPEAALILPPGSNVCPPGAYRIKSNDGRIGRVSDLLFDDQTWAIRKLVVSYGGWFLGSKALIPTSEVDQIMYDESTVSLSPNHAAVRLSPTDLDGEMD